MINKKNLIVIGILMIFGITMGMFLSYLFFHAPELNLKEIWIYIFGTLLYLPGIVTGLYCGPMAWSTWGCASYLRYFAPLVYGVLFPLLYILSIVVYKKFVRK